MAYMEEEISPKRIAAYAIDTSFVIMVSMIIISITNSVPELVILGFLLVCCVFIAGYIVPYTIWRGQTFGKKNQRIKLVNMNGSDCKMVKIIFRELFKIVLSVSTMGIYCIIAGLIMLFRRDERTIHDFIFRTKVIEKTYGNYKGKEE